MRKGIDTTDLLVYGHEAWIVTNKSVYAPGEEVCGILRWGHHMRPDGFFRLDEFRAFVTDEQGNRIALSPVKGPGDEQGDYYELRFTPTSAGIHTIMAIYDNNYVRDENDVYYEGDRRTFPDILDAKNYPQIYETCISVGEKSGTIESSALFYRSIAHNAIRTFRYDNLPSKPLYTSASFLSSSKS